MFNQPFFRDEDFDLPMPANNNDRVFNGEYEVVMKPNVPPVNEPDCEASEKMVKAKNAPIVWKAYLAVPLKFHVVICATLCVTETLGFSTIRNLLRTKRKKSN